MRWDEVSLHSMFAIFKPRGPLLCLFVRQKSHSLQLPVACSFLPPPFGLHIALPPPADPPRSEGKKFHPLFLSIISAKKVLYVVKPRQRGNNFPCKSMGLNTKQRSPCFKPTRNLLLKCNQNSINYNFY